MSSRFARYLRFLIACCALFVALPLQASSSIGARDPIVLVDTQLRAGHHHEKATDEDRDDAADEDSGREESRSPVAISKSRSSASAYEAPDRAIVTRKYIRHCALLC